MIYLVDIDGTLADCEHRLHFIQTKPADWRGFFAACVWDSPIPEVIQTVKLLAAAGARIIYLSGRSDEILDETGQWLRDQNLPDHLNIYMRKAGDHREDSIVKAELLAQVQEDWDSEEILGVFEDRQQVVDMYRSKGLRVYQVAAGKF